MSRSESEKGNSEPEKDQSQDNDSGSEGLLRSTSTSRRLKEKKQRMTLNQRYSKIFYIYLKSFLGRRLSEEEERFFSSYLNQSFGNQKQQQRHFDFINEYDYCFGDIVISFPNPDHPNIEEIESVDPLEFIEMCLSCFCGKTGESDFEVMDNLIFMKAIEQAQYMLKRADQKRARTEDSDEEEDRVLDEQDSPKDRVSSKKDSNPSILRSQQSDSLLDDSQSQHSKRRLPTPQGGGRLVRFGGDSDLVSVAVAQIDAKLAEAKKTDKALRNSALKEVFNLDYHKLKQKAKFYTQGGGFLKYDKKARIWKKTLLDTLDIATLIRHIVLVQLTKLGFQQRLFISQDGQTIFCVLYQNDENLKYVAEKSNMTKQLNFQFSDLFSLEPVDHNLRPLRMNNRLWRPGDYEESQISETFKYLRPKIRHLLKLINFKRIARETNLSQLNQQIFSEGATDILQDENGPTDEEWLAYYSYLLFISERIPEIRRDYQMESDLCLMINRQKRPFELFLSTFSKSEKAEIARIVTNEDLEMISSLQREEQLKALTFEGRSPKLAEIYSSVFQIEKDWRLIQKKFSQVKSFLHVPPNKPVTSKQIKVCLREKLANQYLALFKDALIVTNNNYIDKGQKMLRTLWDEIELVPFEPYIPYNITPKRQAQSQRNKLNSIWTKYCITETGRTSLFSGMERLKLNTLALNEKINFSILFSNNLAKAVFCLNDNFELRGQSTVQLFAPIFSRGLDQKALVSVSQYPYIYRQMIHNESLGLKGPNRYQRSEYEFVEPKPKDLAYQWRFQKEIPWNVPTAAIRNYYGEKIALYFTFLGYYTQLLLPIGILGLITGIIQMVVWDNYSEFYVIPTMVFGFVQIQWCNLMFELWQQREKVFSIKYGQQELSGGDQSQERSDFMGNYERSVQNDNMNTLTYPDSKKLIKMITTLGIQMLMISAYIGVIIGIFLISQLLSDQEALQGINNSVLQFDVTLPAVINVIIILVLDDFYDTTAEKLTDHENHKTIQEYETNFVFKKYFLCFVSLCGPILQILFNHERVGLQCKNDDCFKHAQYYYAAIFLFQFSLNIWEIVKPKVMVFYRAYQARKSQQQMEQIQEQDLKNEDPELDPENELQPLAHETPTTSVDPFQKLNSFIEDEFLNKESYVISPERYGTVDDYLEITLQYSMLALFGPSFPLCFPIAFIWNVLELQTDKLKLLNDMQRPLPLGESSIGVWNGVLEGLSYFSLVANSGVIAYSRERIQDYDPIMSTLFFFLLVLLGNFFLRFVEYGIFGDVSFEIKELMRRHSYLIKSTVEKFRGSTEKAAGKTDQKSKLKRYPLHKVYGCLLIQEQEEAIEELSSDSEVEDYIVNQEPAKKKTQSGKAQALSVNQLQKFLARRVSNWALKFKLPESETPEIRLKQKEFFLKTLGFLRMIYLLNPHAKVWTDDRFTLRYFSLRRQLVLLRNLDWRRMILFKENQKNLKIELKEQQLQKYKKQLDLIELNQDNEQSQVEKEEIHKKMRKFVKKHRWTECRKSIMFKIDGVWFSQYRKKSKKVASFKILDAYSKLVKKYNRLRQTNSTEEEVQPIEEQVAKLLSTFSETQMQKFSKKAWVKFIEKLELKRRERYLYPLTTKGVSLLAKELDPYITTELRKQQNVLSTSFVPFRIQAPHAFNTSNEIWELFVEEQLALKQSPKIILLHALDKKKNLQASSLEFNVYGIRPYMTRWLSTIVAEPNIYDLMMLYHTEIGFHRIVHRDVIHRVVRVHRKLLDPVNASLEFNMPVATLRYIHFQKAVPLLNPRDPIIKGYLTRAYNPPRNAAFCNGKTLKDTLKSRSMLYEDQEICDFIGSTVQLLEYLESECGLYHGSINLNNFILIHRHGHYQYCLIDMGIFFWYDFQTEKTHFTRALESNDELWYMSPELIHNYLNPNSPLPMCPLKCDMYSLGIVCLQMLTLGKMSQQIEKSLKEYEGDVDRAVKRWVVNNRQELGVKFPNCMQLILQLIHPDHRQRLLPSTLLAKIPGKSVMRETSIKFNFENNLENILKQIQEPQITQERMVRIFDGRATEIQQKVQEKIQLIEYLKCETMKIQIYLRTHSMELAEQALAEFEQNLLRQYFFQLPYAKETADVMWCIENYSSNQVYDIIEGNLHEFRYIVFYMLLKAQCCCMQQDFKQSTSVAQKAIEILKSVEVQASYLLKEALRQDQQEESLLQFQLAVMNQQLLGELQFQKETLVKKLKEDQNLFKVVKKQPNKLKQYSKFFNLILMQNHQLQYQYSTAVDIGEEIAIELLNEINHDVKRLRKRTHDGKLIVKEALCIKIMHRLIVSYHRMVAVFDGYRDGEFNVGIHDLIHEFMVMNSFFIHEEANLDTQRPSIIRTLLSGKVLKLREDFRKNGEQTLQFYYLQAKFLQIQHLQRLKDFSEAKKRLKAFWKHLRVEECLFELLYRMPQIAWVGEFCSEMQDEDKCNQMGETLVDIMDDCYFALENFPNEELYMNYSKLLLSQAIIQCSQMAYYIPIALTEGMFEGFYHLIEECEVFDKMKVIKAILMIKVIHVLLHNQQLNSPYYWKARSGHKNRQNDLDEENSEQSLINKISSYYEVVFPHINQDDARTDPSWFKGMLQLHCDLIQGFQYATSNHHFENSKQEEFLAENQQLDRALELKHSQILFNSNRNEFVKLEQNMARARSLMLQYSLNNIPQLIDEIIQSFETISLDYIVQPETKNLLQLGLLSLTDILVNYSFYTKTKYSKMIGLNEFKWIIHHRLFNIKIYIIKIVDYYLKIQETKMASELVDFTIMLFKRKAKLFRKTNKSFYLTLQVYRIRAFQFHEDLRVFVDKYDKSDSTQIEDLFKDVCEASQIIHKNSQLLEIGKLLLSQSLEQNEMNEIKEALLNTNLQTQSMQNQLILCQLGVKLVIYQLHTGQFKEADNTCYSMDNKIFGLIYQKISNCAMRWAGEKIFSRNNQTEISVNQLFRILKISQQGFEKYEHNVLIQMEPLKELMLNVREFKLLKQLVSFRTLYSYLQCLHTLAQIMKGDFRIAQQNLPFIQKFQETKLDEVQILINNVIIQYEMASGEFLKGQELTKLLLKQIQNKQLTMFIQFVQNEDQNTRVYQTLTFEQIIEFQNTDVLRPTVPSLETSLVLNTLKPYFDITKLNTEAYLSYIEATINLPDQLTRAVEYIFATQKYIQQQYGLIHMFNAHILRLIASMYAEFLVTNRLKDLEKELTNNSEEKIVILQQELRKKTLKYLEARVKNQCTPQMEAKFKETQAFIQGQINVLKDIKGGVSTEIVCRWSLQAANESHQVYMVFAEEYQYDYNPFLGYLFIAYADVYFVQNKIVSIMQHLSRVKDVFEYCYTSISNPDYCRLYYKQGCLRQSIQLMIKLYIEALVGLSTLTPVQKYDVLIHIIKENQSYLTHFDSYKSHGFDLFLERNIQQQIKLDVLEGRKQPEIYRKDQKDLQSLLQVESDKIKFQKTVDPKARVPAHIIDTILRDGIAILGRDKIKADYTGEELFQKAHSICKLLFKPDNPLFIKLEDQTNRSKGRNRKK